MSWKPTSWRRVYVVEEQSSPFGHSRVLLFARRRQANLAYEVLTVEQIPNLLDLPLFRRDLDARLDL